MTAEKNLVAAQVRKIRDGCWRVYVVQWNSTYAWTEDPLGHEYERISKPITTGKLRDFDTEMWAVWWVNTNIAKGLQAPQWRRPSTLPIYLEPQKRE